MNKNFWVIGKFKGLEVFRVGRLKRFYSYGFNGIYEDILLFL